MHGDVISHVNISHVMVEDGGEYTCTAENRAGKTSHSARLNIYGKFRRQRRSAAAKFNFPQMLISQGIPKLFQFTVSSIRFPKG